MSEISPIPETYEQQLQTFQSSKTFETLGANCNQPLVQPTLYHNEAQPMSTQQKAAMAQVALINFFGKSGTVTSIMNTVQPSHTQTLNELSDELSKVPTDKVTEYHIIILILILLLIQEE